MEEGRGDVPLEGILPLHSSEDEREKRESSSPAIREMKTPGGAWKWNK